jgi:hypothetical protein
MSALVVVLIVVGTLVIGLISFAAWMRRGERASDPPNARTTCTFFGGDSYSLPNEGEVEVRGEGLMEALTSALKQRGATANDPGLTEYSRDLRVRFGSSDTYLQLGFVGDDGYDWVLTALDPSSGGPCSTDVLPAIDAALRSLLGIRDITWHRREAFLRGDLGTGKPSPLD